jgi:hypothetical protein
MSCSSSTLGCLIFFKLTSFSGSIFLEAEVSDKILNFDPFSVNVI